MAEQNDGAIHELRMTVAEQNVLLEQFIREQREVNNRFDTFVNGSDGVSGAKIRLDRLEQRGKLLSWISSLAIGSVIIQWARTLVQHWPWGSN